MALQSINISTHEHRESYTVYRIDIAANVRSWAMWRRYSEFDALNTELKRVTGSYPPKDLPPKHTFSLRRTFSEQAIVKERLEGLEAYLRAILAAKEPKWRDSFPFKDFLGIPASSTSNNVATASNTADIHFTSASWLDEHSDLQSIVRDIRADINKRDSLSDRGELSGSGTANIQAKRKLAALLKRVGVLAAALPTLATSGMSDGEIHRRSDMIARLQDECEKLGKMVIAARKATSVYYESTSAPSARMASASESAARAELLAGAAPRPKPVTRVFGEDAVKAAAPVETDATRPLDDHGLIQLQEQQVVAQDNQLVELAAILQRQKHLGLAIGYEIDKQINDLDDLNEGVDKFSSKLGTARKQMNKLG